MNQLEFFKTKAERVDFIQIDDYEINYEIHGTGERKMVFLTGFVSSTGVWSTLMAHYLSEANAENYSCLVVNNRGFGRSTGGKARTYKTAGMAMDVIKVLDHIKWNEPKSINLVGVSMGGMISQEVAYHRPHLIKTLCLLATNAHFKIYSWDHFTMPFSLFYPRTDEREKIESLMEILFAHDEWLEAIDERDHQKRTNREVLFSSIKKQIEIDGSPSLKTLGAQLYAVLTHNVEPKRLQKIAQEVDHVVCITGTRDRMIHHSASEYLAKHLSCELVILDKKGHAIPKEADKEVIEVLDRLLDKAYGVSTVEIVKESKL